MKIKRVFVANRGEIAVRIIRGCQALNMETVLAVSEEDRETLGAKLADRVVCIGPPASASSYLNVKAIIAAALATNSDAVHPGYGFLAENESFAELCSKYGLIFIGPSPENIRQMGNKLEARALASKSGLPVIEGSPKINTFDEAMGIAEKIGYPVFIKAASGGGGRGIRIVREKKDIQAAFESASAEAQAAFGDNSLFVERFIEKARHIEVQVMADSFGNVVHLGERDCSMQRRYQKMIEEAPAYGLSQDLREKIQRAAVAQTKGIGYRSAGTIEFIVDLDRDSFYFLEMNTRIQVEHPVTEEVTGRDVIVDQLRIAGGETLGYKQEDVAFSGCAIECRINAESPAQGFRPAPGKITRWEPPQGAGIRLDTHCFQGYTVSPHYDSLLGKLVVHAANRRAAIEGMRLALDDFRTEGIETTVPFLKFVLSLPDYQNGFTSTRFLEKAAEDFWSQEKRQVKR